MYYLVTGCAGFIGARLTRALLEKGHAVTGVDALDRSYDPALKRWRVERLADSERFEFVEADVRTLHGYPRIFHRAPDGVFHLAAKAGVRLSVEDPIGFIDSNVTATARLLATAIEHGVRKLILASTSSVYGQFLDGPADEESPSDRALSPYAASKKAAEVLAHSYHHLFGIDVAVLRYFTVYGPAGRPDMSVFRFVRWMIEGIPITVYGDGSQKRDFTHVDDIVSGTVAAAGLAGFEVINLGSSSPVTVIEVIRTIERITGLRPKIEFRPAHPADVPATHANIAKASRLLGWWPRVSLEEGLSSVVRWYADNREWASKLS